MGSQRKDYYFLGYRGAICPPSSTEVKKAEENGLPFELILDNNVCKHVSSLYHCKDKIKKTRANNFLNYCGVSKITVLPLGLIEGASKPGTLDLKQRDLIQNEDEFWRKFYHYHDNNGLSSVTPDIEDLKPLLYPIYAYLLKIKLILLERKPSQENLRKNIEDLYNFSEQIGIVLCLPWQVAFAIFGGNSRVQKLINKKAVLKGLWGAAWDLSYIQYIHQYNGLRKLNNSNPQFLLVTDDNACSTIGDLARVSSFIDYGDGDGEDLYHNVEVSFDFPHFESNPSFLYEMTSKINLTVSKRSISRASMSEMEEQRDISKIIYKADSFIQNATQEIEFNQKKGFA